MIELTTKSLLFVCFFADFIYNQDKSCFQLVQLSVKVCQQLAGLSFITNKAAAVQRSSKLRAKKKGGGVKQLRGSHVYSYQATEWKHPAQKQETYWRLDETLLGGSELLSLPSPRQLTYWGQSLRNVEQQHFKSCQTNREIKKVNETLKTSKEWGEKSRKNGENVSAVPRPEFESD